MAQLDQNGTTLRVSGAMTMERVNALLGESAGVFAAENMEMDLSDVTEVDSAAISLMFEWLRQAHGHNTSLVFVNLPANLINIATLYGVLDLIPHHTH